MSALSIAKTYYDSIRSSVSLFPFQETAVLWMLSRELRRGDHVSGGVLADEVGLGKTVQMLVVMKANPGRTLVVVPTNLIEQWKEHVQEWMQETPCIVTPREISPESPTFIPVDEFEAHGLVVCTQTCFQSPHCATSGLHMTYFDRVVYDEAHRFKNVSGKMFRNACQVKARVRWCLTATPVVNKRVKNGAPHCPKHATNDLAALLALIIHDHYALRGHDFQTIVKTGQEFAKDFANDVELRQQFFFRRTKSDVKDDAPALDIPPPDISFDIVDMTPAERERYDALYEQAVALNDLKTHGDLKRLCASMNSKVDAIVNRVASYPNGSKVLAFCNFRGELDALRRRLRSRRIPTLVLDGRTKRQARLANVKTYLESQCTVVMLMNYKAGGVGLNLQGTTYVELVSPNWAATDELQAIGRAHRAYAAGTVAVHRYAMRGTIEQFVHKRQESKLYTAAKLLGDPSIESSLRASDGSTATWPEDRRFLDDEATDLTRENLL